MLSTRTWQPCPREADLPS